MWTSLRYCYFINIFIVSWIFYSNFNSKFRFVFIAFYHLLASYFKPNYTWATEKKIALNSWNKIIYFSLFWTIKSFPIYLTFLSKREKMNKPPLYKWHLIVLFLSRVMRIYLSNEGSLKMSPLPVTTFFFCWSFMVIDDKLYKRILLLCLVFFLSHFWRVKQLSGTWNIILSIFKNESTNQRGAHFDAWIGC